MIARSQIGNRASDADARITVLSLSSPAIIRLCLLPFGVYITTVQGRVTTLLSAPSERAF